MSRPTDRRTLDPEFRCDPLTEEWVIIASERRLRPNASQIDTHADEAVDQSNCPFCPGNEEQTPPELARIAAEESDRWLARVIPNRYPAVRHDAVLREPTNDPAAWQAGVGRHELVIETPVHRPSLAGMSPPHLAQVLLVFRDRLRDFAADERLAFGLLFKNTGLEAGASQPHTHTQIIGMTIVPPRVDREVRGARAYRQQTGRCYFCDEMVANRRDAVRLLADSDGIVAWAPFASRFPYEFWVAPADHAADYRDLTEAEANRLAGVLLRLLTALERVLDRLAYNMVLHTVPFRSPADSEAAYHWHLEITPRLSGLAGCEIGGGLALNPVPPEEAAERLRAEMPS